MAYDRQHLRFDFAFRLTGTTEIAYTGLNYSTAPGWAGAVAALGEWAGSVGAGQDPIDLMDDLMSTPALSWADYSTLHAVKIAAIGTDGHYLTEPFAYETETPHSGTATNVPPQCTVVMSLRSGFTLGRANYGRMYLPHTRPALPATYPIMSSVTRDAIAAAGKVFVNALTERINTATTAVLFPAIMSTVGAGTTKGVTAVAVGGVIDTQRRRRNGLVEIYSTEQLA